MYNMTRDKKAAISMDMIAISVISIIVIVVSIMVYFNIIGPNSDNLQNISNGEMCLEAHNCTRHQCEDVLGSIPIIGKVETNSPNTVCCERSCVCPKGKEIELNGIKYECNQKNSCSGEEVEKDLKTDSGVCCCRRI